MSTIEKSTALRGAAQFGAAFFLLLLLPLQWARAADFDAQSIAIAAHVLAFESETPPRRVRIAIVYNPQDPASRSEAASSLSSAGGEVGDLILEPLLVAEDKLTTTKGIQAVFAAAALDEGVLRKALAGSGTVCMTTHADLVLHGACSVAIRSDPSVSITLNAACAEQEGVHFAIAFRMMVHEV